MKRIRLDVTVVDGGSVLVVEALEESPVCKREQSLMTGNVLFE